MLFIERKTLDHDLLTAELPWLCWTRILLCPRLSRLFSKLLQNLNHYQSLIIEVDWITISFTFTKTFIVSLNNIKLSLSEILKNGKKLQYLILTYSVIFESDAAMDCGAIQ